MHATCSKTNLKEKHPVVVGGWGYVINQSMISMSILGSTLVESWAITLAFLTVTTIGKNK
jgi:hypothetical protein